MSHQTAMLNTRVGLAMAATGALVHFTSISIPGAMIIAGIGFMLLGLPHLVARGYRFYKRYDLHPARLSARFYSTHFG